ncbi:hypothetical protein [Rhizobium rhizogenes]|nr:hypothetical protein [Rhizobium rhizogenes]
MYASTASEHPFAAADPAKRVSIATAALNNLILDAPLCHDHRS